MITLKDFMETIQYKITEGSDYCWNCYGPNAHSLDSWNDEQGAGGYTITTVFDKQDQTVYQMEAWDYTNDRCYRWIDPTYIDAYKEECEHRDVDFNNAFDAVDFIDLETEEDILEKARAMVAGEDYDTRVSVPLTLDDDQLFELMKSAHEKDVTLNQLVENILREVIASRGHETGTDNPFDFPVAVDHKPAKITGKRKKTKK
jgi:hypothetical protein